MFIPPINSKCQSAKVIRATRPSRLATNGLITVEVELTYYVQDQANRTSYLAPNFKSHRTKGYSAGVPFYAPETFMVKGRGMTPAGPAPRWKQRLGRLLWTSACVSSWWHATLMDRLGFAYEQSFRLLNAAHVMRGVYTATEHGWAHFVALRTSPHVDEAMSNWSAKLAEALRDVQWTIDSIHLPYYTDDLAGLGDLDKIKVCAARCARISFGSPDAKAGDLRLANSMITRQEWSPFEQTAMIRDLRTGEAAHPSRLCSTPSDVWDGFAWESGRNLVGWRP